MRNFIFLPENNPLIILNEEIPFDMWETGKLSLGQAAKLSGYSKHTFMELLGKHGIPVFNYPAENLEREANL